MHMHKNAARSACLHLARAHPVLRSPSSLSPLPATCPPRTEPVTEFSAPRPKFTETTESVDYAGSIAVESQKEFGSADVKEAQTLWLSHPSEEDSTPIVPRWWTGESAVAESEFVIDAKKVFPNLTSSRLR